jgi:hypothetical protein
MFCEKCGVRFEQEYNTAPQHEEITQVDCGLFFNMIVEFVSL